jgi:hypothetical protein
VDWCTSAEVLDVASTIKSSGLQAIGYVRHSPPKSTRVTIVCFANNKATQSVEKLGRYPPHPPTPRPPCGPDHAAALIIPGLAGSHQPRRLLGRYALVTL